MTTLEEPAAAAPPSTSPPRTSPSYSVAEEPSVKLANCKLLSQGAEARVWEGTFLGRDTICKQRMCKRYRHATLDARLTGARLKQEVRSMLRARKTGGFTPALYHVELASSCIYMERIVGASVKATLASGMLSPQEVDVLMTAVGAAVAQLHDNGIIHGDLTTSNMLVRASDKQLVVIDFGLSSNSQLAEDKGVDLYVLERALLSTHSQLEGLFEKVLASYRLTSKQWSATFNRFAEVRMRGRKRTMVG